MFKKIITVLLVLYVIGAGLYFAVKWSPALKKYFAVKKDKTIVQEKAPEQHISCPGFAIGHIAGEDFRVSTRRINGSEQKPINEDHISEWIQNNSCDKNGQQALIFLDSKPVAIGEIRSYDYSKPFGDTGEKPILYTVLKTKKRATIVPESGYVVAIYGYSEGNIDFYDKVETEMQKNDEDIISGSADTIYHEIVGKDASKTEVEYAAVKTGLNLAGETVISVLATWTDPTLPKDVKYLSVFNIHKANNSNGSSRYLLFPITKIRKSEISIFQVVDVDNDGYKETIIKKERENRDSFTLYDYDTANNIYVEKLL